MRDKIIRKIFIYTITFICIFEFAIFSNSKTESNELVRWGLRRGENHSQAILDKKARKIIDEYNGICLGDGNTNKVYLTFDCGYEAGYTEEILDVLKEKNAPAIFFITGHYFNTSKPIIKRMLQEGHIVGNHTVNHKCLPELSNDEIQDEIMKLHNSIFDEFGYEMKYIRQPKGEISERVVSFCNSLGYRSVMWSFAYDDWDPEKQNRENYGKKKIIDNVHSGEVILLHATSKDNAKILSDCIDEIRKLGYEFCSLKEFE